MPEIAIIGGTGLTELEGLHIYDVKEMDTPFGVPSSAISLGEINGKKVAFLARHGNPHTIPPHKVNYRANIAALAGMGIKKIIAVNAVGGIRSEMAPAHVCVPDQIIDYTWGRASTFFEDDLDQVTHIDFTFPFTESLRQTLLLAANTLGIPVSDNAVYGCTQGPRLETAAEIKKMERDGCDIVGMTGMPEAALAAEMNLEYACVALSVNWAAGKTDHIITMEEIHAAIDAGMDKVCAIVAEVVSTS